MILGSANGADVLQVNHAEVWDDPTLSFHALMGTLRKDLLRWRESLPPHLRFQEEHIDSDSQRDPPHSWKARQRSSLRIRKCSDPVLSSTSNFFCLREKGVFLRHIDLLTIFRLQSCHYHLTSRMA
jgi:hypothetical protein